MRPITTTYDFDRSLTTFKVVGKVAVIDFIDALARYYRGDITPLNLWDLTQADLSLFRTNEIQDLAAYSRRLAGSRRCGRTAVVFSGTLGFGLGRMFETYLEIAGLPLAFSIFVSMDAALKWLQAGADDDGRDKRRP